MSPNQFSLTYFEPPKALGHLFNNEMPEMHVWLGNTKRQEILDLTTLYLPELAALGGFKWEAPAPAPYLWGKASSLPKNVYYKPRKDAMGIAYRKFCVCNDSVIRV